MTPEKVIDCLRAWHQLILKLNQKVSREFIEDALKTNENVGEPAPTIFLSADDTVTYTGLQGFDRLRISELDRKLPAGVTLREVEKTHWDHSHERIPHKHSVSVAVAKQEK